MYTNLFPCHECAKLIIQAGIKKIFYYSNALKPEQWQKSYQASEKMLKASGVNYQKIKK
jgi:dCMP deaminase